MLLKPPFKIVYTQGSKNSIFFNLDGRSFSTVPGPPEPVKFRLHSPLSGVPAFASIAGGSVGQSPLSPTGNGYAAPPIPAVLAIAHKIYLRGWFNTPMLCV